MDSNDADEDGTVEASGHLVPAPDMDSDDADEDGTVEASGHLAPAPDMDSSDADKDGSVEEASGHLVSAPMDSSDADKDGAVEEASGHLALPDMDSSDAEKDSAGTEDMGSEAEGKQDQTMDDETQDQAVTVCNHGCLSPAHPVRRLPEATMPLSTGALPLPLALRRWTTRDHVQHMSKRCLSLVVWRCLKDLMAECKTWQWLRRPQWSYRSLRERSGRGPNLKAPWRDGM